ncbi:hypothetical protein Tco_1435226 [Tanacetum coccineum]
MESNKALVKAKETEDVDVHLYRSMIRSLMYLTASRPDIMFAVLACTRFQVTPKTSHLHAVKKIFRYLKGQPKLGLWYPRDSPFSLEAFSDSDYAGASLDRKSTTRGCQFLGKRGRDTKIPQSSGPPEKVDDEAVHKELGDRMESTLEDGEVEIIATIDGQLKTITEASFRIHLKLEYADGISSLPNIEIFERLALMGYASDSDKLTFQKGHFSP